jgi:hypothetical protein
MARAFEIVDGREWINGTTEWRVIYEYADDAGGGFRVDYFKTANRYTPPTGPELRKCIDNESVTLIAVERVEWVTTDTPDCQPSLEPPPDDSYHKRVFDLISDEPEDNGKIVCSA